MTYFRLFITMSIIIPNVQAADLVYRTPDQHEKTRHVETASRATTCKAAPNIGKDFQLNLLIPESTGYTHQAQPTLYWAVSKPITGKFEFFIEEVPQNKEDYIEPIIETQFESNASAGIHALSLAEYNVELQNNTDYRWSLRLLCHPKGRKSAEDPNANGTLKRITPSPELSKRIQETENQKLPYLYAENGFWFDALDTLSKQIQADPKDKALRELRANLLEQVALPQVAALDR